MMSAAMLAKCVQLKLPAAQKLVLLCLADQGDDNGENIIPNADVIARWCGLSMRQVHHALGQLIRRGHVQGARYAGNLSRYRVTPIPVLFPE